MKKESKINRYTVHTEIIFLSEIDVYATSKKEAINQIKDITEKTDILSQKLDVYDKCYRVKDVIKKDKDVNKNIKKMFIYQSDKDY